MFFLLGIIIGILCVVCSIIVTTAYFLKGVKNLPKPIKMIINIFPNMPWSEKSSADKSEDDAEIIMEE